MDNAKGDSNDSAELHRLFQGHLLDIQEHLVKVTTLLEQHLAFHALMRPVVKAACGFVDDELSGDPERAAHGMAWLISEVRRFRDSSLQSDGQPEDSHPTTPR